MLATKEVLSDISKALANWESEGGAPGGVEADKEQLLYLHDKMRLRLRFRGSSFRQ